MKATCTVLDGSHVRIREEGSRIRQRIIHGTAVVEMPGKKKKTDCKTVQRRKKFSFGKAKDEVFTLNVSIRSSHGRTEQEIQQHV